jgi:hypothetical protein
MSIFSTLLGKKDEILGLITDPRVKDLIVRREFRLTEEYLHQEVFDKLRDEELTDIALTVGDGYAELSGRVKKRMLPFVIPFSARFSIDSVVFTQKKRVVNLKLEELKPLDVDALTKKLVEKVPFLSYADGIVALHLDRVPRLAELFQYQVKGLKPFDFVVLKDLSFRPGEVVGKLGVVL